jgi:TolB protein
MKLGGRLVKSALATFVAVLLAGVAETGPASAASPLPAGGQGGVADVPWSQVGPGWLLSEWAPVAPSQTSGPAKYSVLYLVDPRGGRYFITTWPEKRGDLVAWSGDGKRALFETQTATSSVVTLLQLQNSEASMFKIPGAEPWSVSFTEPDGLAITAVGQVGPSGSVHVRRFDLDGALAYSYPTSFPRAGRLDGGLLYSPDGTELVLGTTRGFEVVANTGQALRYLPMKAEASTCQPERWWAAGVFLASCTPQNGSVPLLWLVPANGTPPTPLTLTPRRASGDYGDVDAWSLPSGDYAQDLGACGYIYLAKVSGHRTTPVRVPGTAADKSVYVLGAYGDRLALTTAFSCFPGSASLMWYDPATNTVTPLLGPPVNGGSVGTTLLWGEPPFSDGD